MTDSAGAAKWWQRAGDRVWVPVLCATVAFYAIVSQDLLLAGVPVKLPLLALTLGAWLGHRRAQAPAQRPRFSFARSALWLAVAVPLLWTAVAAVDAAAGGGLAAIHPSYVLQHANRFAYVLLYFPLAELARAGDGQRGRLVWIVPVFALCGVTFALWLAHQLAGVNYGPSSLPEKLFFGVIGSAGDGYRVFIGNQILLIPAVAVVLAALRARGAELRTLVTLAVLLATAWISHTRGIWLGLSVMALVMIALGVELAPRWRRWRTWLGAAAALILMLLLTLGPTGAIVGHPPLFGDLSNQTRSQEATPLYAAFRARPLLGSGLGAVLASGYNRDPARPWVFELTYLQTLFQMGALGLLAILAFPVAVARSGARRRNALAALPRSLTDAGVGALAGVLVTCATNPFLFASFGMLAIVIAVVTVEQAVTEPERTAPAPVTATVPAAPAAAS